MSKGDLLRKTADQAATPGDPPAVPELKALTTSRVISCSILR
ncbi:hypothetical protein ACE1OA_02785 [Streptomyces sp. JL2001]